VRRAALVLVAACGAAPPAPAPAPPSANPAPATDVIDRLIGANVVGRVELDGAPVTYFGITWVSNVAHETTRGRPIAIHSKDGTFATALPWGHWDLIIAAPGAARQVIAGVDVDAKLDLGTVSLRHGHTLTGVVRDETGQPVPDARVELITDKFLAERPRPDALDNLLHGNISTRTDANGRYTIRGASRELLAPSRIPSLVADASDRRSFPVHAPDADANVDLQVARPGTIDVSVTGSNPMLVTAEARGAQVFADPVGANWRFEHIPAGTYDVTAYSAGMHARAHQTVTVHPDAVASLALMLPPSAPVEVAITATKAACSEIQLRDARNNEVRIAHCNAGVATFPRLAPGTYLACIDKRECHAIAVDDTPAQQKFTLVR
jgi:hypothetical protein